MIFYHTCRALFQKGVCIVAGKRKDKNGRILKTGENQRKNGTYDYRYTDGHGKVRCVYAKTLEALREKEATIQRDQADGIDYAAGEITVSELVGRYMSLKRDIGHNTLRAYGTVINRINESELGQSKVRNVKLSDAKRFYIMLHDSGEALLCNLAQDQQRCSLPPHERHGLYGTPACGCKPSDTDS